MQVEPHLARSHSESAGSTARKGQDAVRELKRKKTKDARGRSQSPDISRRARSPDSSLRPLHNFSHNSQLSPTDPACCAAVSRRTSPGSLPPVSLPPHTSCKDVLDHSLRSDWNREPNSSSLWKQRYHAPSSPGHGHAAAAAATWDTVNAAAVGTGGRPRRIEALAPLPRSPNPMLAKVASADTNADTITGTNADTCSDTRAVQAPCLTLLPGILDRD